MGTKCPKCDFENPDDTIYCGKCATPLKSADEISITKTLTTLTERLQKGITIAGKYKILEELGRGGMGVVYKAEDTKLKRTVALKFLPPELTHISEVKERFMREAQAAAALDHPNICTVYEFDEAEEKTFISMAYIEGQSLKEKIESGLLELDEALRIAIQIAEGLQEAHKNGVVHRDIKSANIMVTEKDQAKIMDFGLARIAGGTLVTKEGMAMGTIAYMSPEQARGEEVDHRTDIWSLGVVLYEVFTGQLPFKGEHDQAVVYSILNEKPEPITSLNSGIPMVIEQVVGKALEKNPDERYQHIEELLDDLRAISEGIEPEGIRARLRKAKLLRSKKAILYVSIGAISIVLIVIALSLFTGRVEAIDSIAVLPFENMTGDPNQEYFVDGMTEALIANLARINSLRVISRTSIMQYKKMRKPLPEIARELNVEAIVEGSVARSDGRVRITAQLIDAPKDQHLWADSFDRDTRDILTLQSELAAAIVRQIQVKLMPQEMERLTNTRRINPDAYQLYMQGRDNIINAVDLQKALECFQQATYIDPTFAEAYAGIALSYIEMRLSNFVGGAPPQEIFPRAKAAAIKAIELDDTIGLAYATLGTVKQYFDWDWEGAEQDFQRALELAPQDTEILYGYSDYMIVMGRFDEGIAMRKKVLELDPLSFGFSIAIGVGYRQARRYDEGIVHLIKMRDMYPVHSNVVNYHLAWTYAMKGMYQEAIDAAEKTFSGELFLLPYIYSVSGQRDKALELLAKIVERSRKEYVEPIFIAMVYCGLGDKEQALQWLIKGYESRAPFMVTIKIREELDPLRSDPRFIELLKKMGFEK